MLKIKKIEKYERYIYIYFKIPLFSNFRKTYSKLKQYEDEEASLEPKISLDGKYIILSYVLRNREDILPYVKNKR